jgi:outer membrane protein
MYRSSSGSKGYAFITVFYVITVSFFYPGKLSAQPQENRIYYMSIHQAIDSARLNNKWVKAAKTEQLAADADLKDAYSARLPVVNASASYQRFTDLTLFTGGLSHSETGPRKPTPNAANAGIDAIFNIYTGGRQRAFQQQQAVRRDMSAINTLDQAGNVGMQAATQYLDLIRLEELRKFILEQLKRAQTRIKNINTLYTNQKVTRSDVLRAQVMLSNVELSLQQTENDITICKQRLSVLLNVPDSIRIQPTDSAGMIKPELADLQSLILQDSESSYAVQKAKGNIQLQQTRLKELKSFYRPTVSLYSAYGLNYPNYLFFPPVDQAYTIGFLGIRAQYSISSLYQNKNKVAASKLRITGAQIQREAIADQVMQDLKSYLIKYQESLSRIGVTERSIEQARVNLRIVNTKYFNQLALLTDLLDADNLFVESRFNLIKAQTDALAIYYHLLYTAGKL